MSDPMRETAPITGPRPADAAGPLPERRGPRPRTTATNPHSQLDQHPERSFSGALLERCAGWPGVTLAPSRRAPRGTVGLHLETGTPGAGERAFLLGREFAHVHPSADGSLHLILPEPLRSQAIGAGWAEPHPMAGLPTVSPDTVMVYGPRDEAELGVVAGLVEASWRNVLGAAR